MGETKAQVCVQNTKAGQLRKDIYIKVSKITDVWILEQVLKCIVNITK